MKSSTDKGKTAVELDLRVRPRLLASGALDPKAVETYLAELPDLEGEYESLPFPQPALVDKNGSHGGDGR